MTNELKPRIESELEIKSYLQNLRYALERAFTSDMFPYKKYGTDIVEFISGFIKYVFVKECEEYPKNQESN